MLSRMSAVMTVAIVAVLLVGAALVGARARADGQSLMPEVVVTAEMPRLVMPTVQVHATSMVAMSGPSQNVN